jgi:hypothetical protein
VKELDKRIFMLVNLANMDRIGLDERIVCAINFRVSCGFNLSNGFDED